MKREHGFTLVELMATMALLSVLLTLGVGALRYFFLGQALTRERDEIYTNLRALQQQVVAESNPIVLGAWFKVTTPATDTGADHWGTFRFTPPSTCTSTGYYRANGGVLVSSAEFSTSLAGASVTDVINACDDIPQAATATDWVLFVARGTATSGCVTLSQPNRDMDDATVAVSNLTGRVERIEPEEVGARCP